MSKGPTWRDLSPEETLALWEAYGKLPAPRYVDAGDQRDRPECGSGMGYALADDWIQCVYHKPHPKTRRKGRKLRLLIGQFYKIKSINHSVWLNAAGQVRSAYCYLTVYRDDGAQALYTSKNFRFIPPFDREPREPSKVHPFYGTWREPAQPLILKPVPPIIPFEQHDPGSRKICLD